MRPLRDMTVIQIEVTNACDLRCANCTRFVGHHRKPFFMDLDMVRRGIESLLDFPGRIGLMGGEPTVHPKFAEICKIYQELIPDRRKREFWTNGCKWAEYKSVILETFDPDLIAYNDHSTPDGKHHPLLVAIKDVVKDEARMWSLIDNCWVQRKWSASITPKGAFFCEIAAAMDHLFDGPGGWPVEKGWWKRLPPEFRDQVERCCPNCGAAVPMHGVSDKEACDLVSESNLARLEQLRSPKFNRGLVKLFSRADMTEDIDTLAKGWQPSHFRTFVAHCPEDYPEEFRRNPCRPPKWSAAGGKSETRNPKP